MPLLTLSIISVISVGLFGLIALNLKCNVIDEVQEKKSDFIWNIYFSLVFSDKWKHAVKFVIIFNSVVQI